MPTRQRVNTSDIIAAPTSIVVLDLETTGLDPRDERIIEVGAVRLDHDLAVVKRFSTLVAAAAPLRLATCRLVGLDDADFVGAPPEADALLALIEFAGDALLVGHNVSFDRQHLDACAARTGIDPLRGPWLDTLEAAVLLLPEVDSYALSKLALEFGWERRAHRALPDAETAADLLRLLAARARDLDADIRSLLVSAAWAPLQTLDRLVPQCSPSAAITAPPSCASPESSPTALAALDVDFTDWQSQLGAGDTSQPAIAARAPGFRRRESQVALAQASAAVFARGGVGLYEAGTGSGKSLAYLLPAAYWSAASGRRVVISTQTKALQHQLAAGELPLVEVGLPPDWRWSVLMGRENYLCERRLQEALAAPAELAVDEGRALALAFLAGRSRRIQVDLGALPYRALETLDSLSRLAHEMRSTRAACLGRFCSLRRVCPWRRARSAAEASHVVCVNHALLLVGQESLPAFADVVIDEAHLLGQAATEAFSRRLEAAAVARLVRDLRAPGRSSLRNRLRAAARENPEAGVALSTALEDSASAADDLPGLARGVGDALAVLAHSDDRESSASGSATVGHGRPKTTTSGSYNVTVTLGRSLMEAPAWNAFADAADALSRRLEHLGNSFDAAVDALPETTPLAVALTAVAEEVHQFSALLVGVTLPGERDQVTWAELPYFAQKRARGGAGMDAAWTIARAPLSVATHMRASLWDRMRSVVLTSATLTVEDSFAYYRETVGLDRDLDVDAQVFPSPFSYPDQAVLVMEAGSPHSSGSTEAHARLASQIADLGRLVGGRTLALFTNTDEMRRVANTISEQLASEQILVLAQGVDGSAASLAAEFRTDPATLLMGVDSLWTGQDFPGETLVCLVIARLPFPRQDPLFEARRALCKMNGENWFEKFYLPEAVLRFRQGFGRLIRSESDRGVVVVLDPRLSHQAYGRIFLNSIPPAPVVAATTDELPAIVEHHLRRLLPEIC
ncbi:MAG: helicase C-terminal domain-containing protein [Thermoleophilia bacterium]